MFKSLLSVFSALCVAAFATGTAAQVEPGLIRTASPVTPNSLGNPYPQDDGTSIRVALFDGLTVLSRAGALEPALATSWESTGPTTWVFRLRENVVFHNGVPFTADAVVASIEFLMQPASAQYYAARYVGSIAAVEALDPMTVVITTNRPDPILPNRLANVIVVEPGAWKDLGADGFAKEPVGTGPFALAGWGPGNRVIDLTKFEPAWRPSKSVTRVNIVVLPDAATRLQALLSDQVDIAVNLDPDTIPQIEAAGLTLIVLPAPHIVTMALRNVGQVPEAMRDKRVRQALNYAVNKQVMAETILSGQVRVPSQVVTPEVFGFNPALTPYTYNPALARSLLAEAGYGNGLELTFGVFSGQTPADTLLFQLMQQDLSAVGVDVTLRLMTFPDLMGRISSGEWGDIDAYSSTISSARFGDASQAVVRLSCLDPRPFFCEPSMNDLIEQSEREMDRSKREALLQEIMARFHDEAPALLLVDYSALTGTSNRVTNYRARANGVQFEEILLVE